MGLLAGVPLRVSFPLFVLAAVAALLVLRGREGRPGRRPALLLLPLGFFSVMVAVRGHDLLMLGNLLASTGLLLLLAHLWGEALGRMGSSARSPAP